MKKLFFTFIVALAIALTACDSSTMAIKQQPESKASSSAAYGGKPVAPIAMDYLLRGESQTGLPLSITINIRPLNDANTLRVEFNTSDALSLVDTTNTLEFNGLAAGEVVSHTLQVIPQTEGKHHLWVNVFIDSVSGRAGARSFSVPVNVGNVDNSSTLPSGATIQPGNGKENLIIQKGAETRTIER